MFYNWDFFPFGFIAYAVALEMTHESDSSWFGIFPVIDELVRALVPQICFHHNLWKEKGTHHGNGHTLEALAWHITMSADMVIKWQIMQPAHTGEEPKQSHYRAGDIQSHAALDLTSNENETIKNVPLKIISSPHFSTSHFYFIHPYTQSSTLFQLSP